VEGTKKRRKKERKGPSWKEHAFHDYNRLTFLLCERGKRKRFLSLPQERKKRRRGETKGGRERFA